MNTFSKKERLSSKKNIQRLFEQGENFFHYPFKIYKHTSAVSEANEAGVAVLFSVSKRQFKHAVDRNRVKRVCRESYRLNKSQINQAAHEKNLLVELAFVYVGKALPDFATLTLKMQKIVHQIASSLGK